MDEMNGAFEEKKRRKGGKRLMQPEKAAKAAKEPRAEKPPRVPRETSGKTGKVSVSLDIYAGFQNVTKKMDLMNAQEFVEFSREAFNNNYISKVPGASASDPLLSLIHI